MFFLKMKTMGAKLHQPHHPLPRQTRIVDTVQTQKALLYSTKKLLRLAFRVVYHLCANIMKMFLFIYPDQPEKTCKQ